MKYYMVGICDSDTDYVMGFMDFINMKEDIPFRISAFSGVDAVLEYLKKNRLDLLLLDESLSLKETEISILELSGNKMAGDNGDSVYKYQSIYKISEIIVRKLENGKKRIKQGCVVYGIYSPLGRSGKTGLARGICSVYDESLYIGFEEYPGFCGKLFESTKYRDIYERFMYYLLSKNPLITDIIGEIYEETGVNVFLNLNYMDLKHIEEQHLSWLIGLLKNSDSYRRIVFDVGTGVLSDLNILSSMDRIYVPVLKDNYSQNKLNLFKYFISDKKYAALSNKMQFIEVPSADFDSKLMKEFIGLSGM